MKDKKAFVNNTYKTQKPTIITGIGFSLEESYSLIINVT